MRKNNQTRQHELRQHALQLELEEKLDMSQKMVRLEEKLIDIAVSNYVKLKEDNAPRYIVAVGDYVVNEEAIKTFRMPNSSAETADREDINMLIGDLYKGFFHDKITYITFYGATLYDDSNWRDITTTLQTARLAHSKTNTYDLLFEFINEKTRFHSVLNNICKFNYRRNYLAYGWVRERIENTPDWCLIEHYLVDICSAEMSYSNNEIRSSIREIFHDRQRY